MQSDVLPSEQVDREAVDCGDTTTASYFEPHMEKLMHDKSKIGIAVVGAVLIAAAVSSYTSISAGHVGVVKRFDAVTGVRFEPGLHWKLPFVEKVEVIDVRIASVNAGVNAGSGDQQEVRARVSVQYFLNPVVTPTMVEGLGDRKVLESVILANAIQESVKAVIAKYTAGQLLTQRPEVKIGINQTVESYIKIALTEKKLDGLVRIANISINDIDFSDEFNRAIEAKVKAQQQAQQALAAKMKRITNAEAQAAEVKLAAEARAYKVTKEAEARAGAIEAEGAALRANPGIVQLRIAESWNGHLPKINSGVLPMLDLGRLGFSVDKE